MSSKAIGVGIVDAGSGAAGGNGAPSGRVVDPTFAGCRGSELALGMRAVVDPTRGNPIFCVVRGTSGDDGVDDRAPRRSSDTCAVTVTSSSCSSGSGTDG